MAEDTFAIEVSGPDNPEVGVPVYYTATLKKNGEVTTEWVPELSVDILGGEGGSVPEPFQMEAEDAGVYSFSVTFNDGTIKAVTVTAGGEPSVTGTKYSFVVWTFVVSAPPVAYVGEEITYTVYCLRNGEFVSYIPDWVTLATTVYGALGTFYLENDVLVSLMAVTYSSPGPYTERVEAVPDRSGPLEIGPNCVGEATTLVISHANWLTFSAYGVTLNAEFRVVLLAWYEEGKIDFGFDNGAAVTGVVGSLNGSPGDGSVQMHKGQGVMTLLLTGPCTVTVTCGGLTCDIDFTYL